MSQKRWLSFITMLLAIQLTLIAFAFYQLLSRTTGEFYQATPTGEVSKLVQLQRPSVSNKALLNWATLAATATYTFDFVHYQNQLAALRDYFTADGYQKFLESISAAGTIATIDEKNLVLSAVAIGPAIILYEEETKSNHIWRVQVPILVRYQSASVNETRQHLVTVLITQVPTDDAPKGIGIAQYLAQETGAEVTG